MTKVINLFGGSGLGKSTTAAGLFYEMKLRGVHCELIQEYVKQWAWEGRTIGPMDQSYIFGKQSKKESTLYGKVDFAVTDSPLLLSPIYESFYNSGNAIVSESAFAFLKKAQDRGVEHVNFLLQRHKPFDTRGRYETAEQAKTVDAFVLKYLQDNNIEFTVIDAIDRNRVPVILGKLGF